MNKQLSITSWHLKEIDFPLNQKNVFMPKHNEFDQKYEEKLLTQDPCTKLEIDRRKKFDEIDFWPCMWGEYFKDYIGILRMKFGNKYYVGTGTMIDINNYKNNSMIIILTCAHNVVAFNENNKNFEYADAIWFSNENIKALTCYVYPLYFNNPSSISGNDLAIIIINNKPSYIHINSYGIEIMATEDIASSFKDGYKRCTDIIAGYPGEKNGEFWGMERFYKKNSFQIKNEIIMYDQFDTTPGQSGSPIIQNDIIYSQNSTYIIGVHTGGDAKSLKKNWGTKLTKEKIKWIKNIPNNMKFHQFD